MKTTTAGTMQAVAKVKNIAIKAVIEVITTGTAMGLVAAAATIVVNDSLAMANYTQ